MPSNRVFAALTACTLGVGGCALFGDDTPRATMQPTPAIEHTLEQAKRNQHYVEGWPSERWWTTFGSPTLNRLIDSALADNPDLKAVDARLRQSQAFVDAQAAEQYPTIDANVSFAAQRFSANSVQVKFAGEQFRHLLINPLVLKYHLDFWGRDEAALQAAIGQSLAVAAEQADARLLLAVAVAGAYFDAVAAAHRLRLAEALVDDREALLKLERVRLDTGLADASPLRQADLALQSARQARAAIEAELAVHQHRLSALIGRGPDVMPNTDALHDAIPQAPTLPADLPLRLIARRPDLSAARLYAEAAAEDIKVAETAFYPDVNLIAFTGLHSVSLTDIALQGSSLAYAVGPSIDIPLFEGGRLRANLSYQQARYDAAVERYNGALLHAVQDVADSLARWQEWQQRLQAQRDRIADADTEQGLSESLARNGLSHRARPLLARIAAHQERLLLATAQAEHCKAAVGLIKALGGGYDNRAVEPTPP